MNIHSFTGKTLRVSALAAMSLAFALTLGCASGDKLPKERVYADHIDVQYNVPYTMADKGTFDELTFNLLDAQSELEGQFRMTTGPETCSCTNAGATVNILMSSCDSISYVSRGNSGVLVAVLPGQKNPQYICDITDEYWDKIVEFTAKWQSHAKFVRVKK